MAAPVHMGCPACGTRLLMSERQGIEIDYCPECRGVWLDRGELDKLVERSAAVAPADIRGPALASLQGRLRDRDERDERHRHGKRRKSFLEELFD